MLTALGNKCDVEKMEFEKVLNNSVSMSISMIERGTMALTKLNRIAER